MIPEGNTDPQTGKKNIRNVNPQLSTKVDIMPFSFNLLVTFLLLPYSCCDVHNTRESESHSLVSNSLRPYPFWFPQCVCPAVGLLDHKAVLFPVF